MQAKDTKITLARLAQLLDLTLEGNPAIQVSGIATLHTATGADLSFYHNSTFFTDLKNTRAAAVILTAKAAAHCPVAKLVTPDPYLAYARASRLFEQAPEGDAGIHATAVIHDSASIGAGVSIGPHVVIDAGAVVGSGCTIGANAIVGRDSRIGRDGRIYPNVTIYPGVTIGERVIIHAAVVIGSDGFGFAREGRKQVKIAQLGGVEIGDDVEIGAGTTIDRGALENTRIARGVKIDNQVQIAHNVTIGENTVICGCSAVAGSSSIGKNCTIAGAVGIINHVSIADGVTVTAMSLVNKSITKKGMYSSGTGLSETTQWKKSIVYFRQLDKLNTRLKALENKQK